MNLVKFRSSIRSFLRTISFPRRRISYHIRDKVKVKVDGLIQKNFVEYSDSPSNAPLVPVMNKNGDI